MSSKASEHLTLRAEPDSEQSTMTTDAAEKQQAVTNISTSSPSSGPPDGGFKAWSVVAGAWCCLFCSFGWINCIGIFQTQYQTDQLRNYTPSTVAWITSVETFVMYSAMPILGKVYDLYGPKPLLYGGTFMHVFGLMMASLASQYYQILLSQSICSAIGASAIFQAALGPVGSWFMKRRALAFGIVAAGSSLSGCVLPIMIVRLGQSIHFAWAMRICAFLFLFLLIIACLTVKSRVPPKQTPWEFVAFFRPFKEAAFSLMAVGLMLFSGGMFIAFNFIPLEAQHRGLGDDLSVYMISILNGASVFGRIIPGYAGDKLGRFNVMIVTTLLSAVLALALWIPAPYGSTAATAVFSALFGFTSGTFVSMTPALIAQLSKIEQIGIRSGAAFGTISIAALTSSPIAGALIQRNGGEYLYLKIFSGLAMLVGATMILMSRTVQVGWKWAKI